MAFATTTANKNNSSKPPVSYWKDLLLLLLITLANSFSRRERETSIGDKIKEQSAQIDYDGGGGHLLLTTWSAEFITT